VVDLGTLIERAQARDLDAYGEIVRRFQDMAYGYAYSILDDFHLAQDAAQEAFIQAYRDLKALRKADAFPGWFRRIVFKQCDRILRNRRPVEPLATDGSEPMSEEPGPSEAAEKRELSDRVLEAVRSLPESQRTVTTLFYIDGYTVNDIADFLETPAGTVKRRLHDSRRQLRKRMIAMVADTFKEHGLPDGFTEETVQKALQQARQLDKERKWVESEQMLRQVLDVAPGHTELLRALNHALQRGRIWGRQQYRLLPELVEHGHAILEASPEAADAYANIADTLLYVPDMPAAIEFIESWIRAKGPSLESLHRLAWAQACMRHDEERDATWDRFMQAAGNERREARARQLTLGALAMVDCLASSGQTQRAQEVVTAGWKLQREQPQNNLRWLAWVGLHRRAALVDEAVALAREYYEYLARSGREDADTQGDALMARAWFDEFGEVFPDWLAWVKQKADASDSAAVRAVIPRMFVTLERMEKLAERRILGLETAAILRTAADDAIVEFADHWVEVTAFAPEIYVQRADPDGAEHAAHGAVAAGYPEEAKWLYDVAIFRGDPSPRDLMQLIEEKGVDEAPHGALYHVAREAAAAGDEKKAFEFLQRACDECWWLCPNVRLRAWENDARWGKLRGHAEFSRIIEEKQRRVGPATGQLMYHPGW